MICKWCKGTLGPILTQEHDNPDYAEYRVCMKCDYQWAKLHWKEEDEGASEGVISSLTRLRENK
tara:strand:+ start:42 stop:233 length:192 start_codon:yes stop_codon:yes gene_type:complete